MSATSRSAAEEPSEPPRSEQDATSRQPPAVAAPEQRVVLIVRTAGDEDTISRLRLEFQDGGWRVLELRPDERLEAEPLASAAEREHVAAAVRVDAARGVVELWVRRPEGSVVETLTSEGERSSGQVLAVRAAEALRARGLLLPPDSASSPEQDPARRAAEEPARRAAGKVPTEVPTPAPTPTPEREPARFSVDLGPGLALSPGGLGPLAVLDLGLRLELSRAWSLCAVGVIPISHQALQGEEGEAEVASYVVGGLVELEWARWSFGGFRSGLGAGGSVTAMAGSGTSGFEGATDTVAAFTPLARISFHANLLSWLRLRTAVLGGATLPPVRVAFGEREVARWGRPFGVASISLEVSAL